MFIADGEPDTDPYGTGIPNDLPAIAVGWLEPEHAYDRGPSDEAFVSALFRACADHASARTRGWHRCGFCAQTGSDNRTAGLVFSREASTVLLDDAEIRVVTEDGKVFIAPTLVLHYVVEHGYRPLGEFVEAVGRGVFAETA